MNFMQKTVIGLALSTTLAVPGLSFADHSSGYYLSATANRLSADFDDSTDVSFSDSDNAGGVRIGYMFGDYIGAELGFIDLGSYSATGSSLANRIDLDARAFTGAVVLNLPVLPLVNLYGKAGVFYVEADAASSIGGSSLSANEDAAEPFGAVGIEADLGHVTLFGELSRVNTDVNKLTVDIATVGIKYKFLKH